jgi:RNA polymerase sigma-70 factor (ECF subfamily)
MVVAMAETARPTTENDIVIRARTDAEALGRLYDAYYDSIYRFCLCRVFNRETAEDVTSTVFLAVARGISNFRGRTESDFRNWLYRIAANHANSYIRRTTRRKELLTEAARMMRIRTATVTDDPPELDWPTLYTAISKLRPKHQTIVTLRFFENLGFEEIAAIVRARPSTVRVSLHRALKELRKHLQSVLDGGT